MAETIAKGYVTKITDYRVFDQIVGLLLENGQKHSLIALGARKINSKNARHLMVGNFNEFEFFASRAAERIGKLKRTVAIAAIDWKIYDYKSFWLLNECVDSAFADDFDLFAFYDRTLNLIKKNAHRDFSLVVYILLEVVRQNGAIISSARCHLCGSDRLAALDPRGGRWLCAEHFAAAATYHLIRDSRPLQVLVRLLRNERVDGPVSRPEAKALVGFLKRLIDHNFGIGFKTLKNW